jgi:hypothetical protein
MVGQERRANMQLVDIDTTVSKRESSINRYELQISRSEMTIGSQIAMLL